MIASKTNRAATIATLAIALLVGANVVGVARRTTHVAAAQTADELKQAKDLYLEGKALFEKKKYAEAVEKFKESYRLSHNPLLLFNIALTFANLGTNDMALFYYKKFLTDSPATDANAGQRADAEKAVKDLEAATVDTTDGTDTTDTTDGTDTTDTTDGGKGTDTTDTTDGGKGTDTTDTTDGGKKPPPREYTIADFEHEIVDEAPPGKPLDLIASPDDAPWTVTLYYRGQGQEKYVAVPMRSHHNTLVGRIPAEEMKGNAVQYYIEVKDAGDALLTRIGKSTSPNVVYLDESARPQYYPDLEDDGAAGGNVDVHNTGDDDSPPGFGEKPTGPKVTMTPEGPGFTDVGSSKFKKAKWATTGAGVGMLTLSITFGLMASSYAASLEAEAAVSNDETCTEGQPCRTFDDYRKGIQDTGKRYELISEITLGVGIVATGVAAWFWWKELKAPKHVEANVSAKAKLDTGLSSLRTAPILGNDLVGAAAALRF